MSDALYQLRILTPKCRISSFRFGVIEPIVNVTPVRTCACEVHERGDRNFPNLARTRHVQLAIQHVVCGATQFCLGESRLCSPFALSYPVTRTKYHFTNLGVAAMDFTYTATFNDAPGSS